MALFTLDELEATLSTVRQFVPTTPSYAWPLLKRQTGVEIIVKHENHTPTGSFKARGGFAYVDALCRSGDLPKALVTATRGNHGQSIALGAARNGIKSVIVVPEGNSLEKNSAMEAFGAEIIIAGKDFDESRVIAAQISAERDFQMVPSFHRELVKGVATYAHELFSQAEHLDAIYVPVGMGSGICGLITVRDLLGLKTKIIGVVAENAPAFSLSFDAGRPVSTDTARTFADGMACREPQTEALDIIMAGAARIVQVSDDQIAEAVRTYYTATHNLAEGAGAAALAALMSEQAQYSNKRVGVILSGGNVDKEVFQEVLTGRTPKVS